MERLSLEGMSVMDFCLLSVTLVELDSKLRTYDEEKEYTPEELTEFGATFGQRFQIKREPEDIRQAVRILGRAQSLMERYTPGWLRTTNNLSAALINMYEQTRDVKYLNCAVDLLTQLAEHIPSDEGNQPAHLMNLWSALNLRFEHTQRMKDLNRLIRVGEEIIEHTDSHSEIRLLHLQNQQAMLFKRYARSRRLEDQKAAIDTLYLLVKELPADNPQRAEHLDWLAKSVIVYYYLARDTMPTMGPEEKKAAMEMLSLIVSDLPGDSPDLEECLEVLTKMVVSSCNQMQSPSALIELAEVGEKLLARIPSDAKYLAGIVNITGSGYLLRYTKSDDLAHLEKAIQHLEDGIARCAPNPFYLRQCYFNLGNAYKIRYEKHKHLEDLDRSAAALEQALALSEPGASARSAYLSTLIDVLEARFERTENLADLERMKELRAQIK
jgi:tetratricopeptide (TPR) repeat protein